MEEIYRKQVELLIRCLPEVQKQSCFALKGGTAINLFIRDMPRLSVDIDLVYIPIEPRAETLTNIEDALNKIANDIEKYISGSTITKLSKQNYINKLFIEHDGVTVKIEPNIVQRGLIFETEEKVLCKCAENEFEASVTVTTIAEAEIYGSKITAALDRQHPRDLFDVKLLLENEGITDDIRKSLIIYIASHPRPMSELLNPNLKNIEQEFRTQFQGMSGKPLKLTELVTAREQLIHQINNDLTENERKFLLSVKMGEPEYSLIDIPNIEKLPAIQWKLQNINKMEKLKHQSAVEELRKVLKL